ncbi:MAG: T9SS type A sorting domain-containing protein [Bacteroidetes bacterium]|nr:T9SS type A sorting domain-containing protein [Bacteroidota bacterium]
MKKYLLLIFAFLFIGITTKAQVCFVTHVDYSAGSQPYQIVTDDFNKDGNLDLAYPNMGDNNISVSFGDGNGVFATPTNYATSTYTQAIGSGNFNADVFPDIVYTTDGNVYVMLNNGSGGFGAPTMYISNSGPMDLASGDFNGDGFTDIVSANQATGNIALFLGNGAGVFGTAINFTTDAGPIALICDYINNDVFLDVVVCNVSANNISVLLGDGVGGFATSVNYAVNASGPTDIAAADFDLDGDKDIVVGYQNSNVISVLLNNGAGVYSGVASYPTGIPNNNMSSIVTKDFNSDGKPDVVVNIEYTNLIAVFLGDGLGAFGTAVTFGTDIAPRFLCSGDFNNDGRFDIATSNYNSNSVSVLLNNPVPVVQASATDTLVCLGQSITLNGIGGTTYTWTPQYIPGFNTLNGVPFPPEIGVITYTVSSSVNGCIDTDTLTITTVTNPTLNLPGFYIAVCEGDSAVLNATGNAASYTWTNGVINNVPFMPTLSFQTFSVTATSTYGCQVSSQMNVQIMDNPTASITTPSYQPCIGTDFLLTSNSSPLSGNGNTYIWTGPTNGTPAGSSPSSNTTLITSSGTYTLTFVHDYMGCYDTATVTINFNPLPVVNANASVTYTCANDQITLYGSGNATSYNWSNGVFDNSPFNISTTTNYTVTGIDTNTGCYDTAQIQVNTTSIVAPNLCMVTVDDPGNNNVIYWDKTLYSGVDTFLVYREITNGNYQVIGRVPYDSLSQFVDTVRFQYFPSTGDPRSSSFRYKLAIMDTCGNVGPLSPYHATMFLQDQLNGNFNWTHYQIEGLNTASDPVPQLSYYLMLRDNNLDGIYETTIGGTSSDFATDPQYFSFNTTADWRIETVWSISCNPTLRLSENNDLQTVIVRSKSNIKNNRTVGIKDNENHESVLKVYPNPASTILNVELEIKNESASITIENMLGQVVYTKQTTQQFNQLSTSTLVSGVYFVKLSFDNKVYVGKIIIE